MQFCDRKIDLLISSLKNSTKSPQLSHATSKIASNPHSWVLFPVHFLITSSSNILVLFVDQETIGCPRSFPFHAHVWLAIYSLTPIINGHIIGHK